MLQTVEISFIDIHAQHKILLLVHHKNINQSYENVGRENFTARRSELDKTSALNKLEQPNHTLLGVWINVIGELC